MIPTFTPQSYTPKKEALFQIVDVITSHLNVSRIYIMGKRLNIEKQASNYFNNNREIILKFHFDLLVLTVESYSNGIASVNDLIEKKWKGLFTATIYLHREIHLQQLAEKQYYFFYRIMKSENLIFQNPNYYCSPLSFSKPTVTVDYLLDFWQLRFATATAFLEAAERVKHPCKTGAVLFIFHQLAEQICLGLIAVFLNYYPAYFQLNYLFNICSHFTDLTIKLFTPCNEKEKKLIELLCMNPSQIRKDKPVTLDSDEVLILHNLLKNFVLESSGLVQKQMEDYRNTKNGEIY